MNAFNITVNYIGIISSKSGKRSEKILISEEKTIQDLLFTLGYSIEHQRFILITANGREACPETILCSDMEINLFLLSGGG